MEKPKKRGPKPTITIWRDPKIDLAILQRIYVEASQEIEVLDALEKKGGKATIKQLSAIIPALTEVHIKLALQRQEDAGNVQQTTYGMKKAWELV